jgi:hypothetical protein
MRTQGSPWQKGGKEQLLQQQSPSVIFLELFSKCDQAIDKKKDNNSLKANKEF